jgi:hypothetical protein
MLGTVSVVGLGGMDVAGLLGELFCGVGWLGLGLDEVGEPVREAAFGEVPVAFAEVGPSECTDAAAEAVECDGADPLHAAVSAAKATIYIRRHRLLRCGRSFVLSSVSRRKPSAFNPPPPTPGGMHHLPRD